MYAYEPNILIADASDAITNAFKAVFDELSKRVMCWFYMVKASEDHESFLAIPSPHKENIKQDICVLQLSEPEEIFNAGFSLFKEKWIKINSQKNPSKAYFIYFEVECLTKHPGWYEGYSLMYLTQIMVAKHQIE